MAQRCCRANGAVAPDGAEGRRALCPWDAFECVVEGGATGCVCVCYRWMCGHLRPATRLNEPLGLLASEHTKSRFETTKELKYHQTRAKLCSDVTLCHPDPCYVLVCLCRLCACVLMSVVYMCACVRCVLVSLCPLCACGLVCVMCLCAPRRHRVGSSCSTAIRRHTACALRSHQST